MAEDMLTAEEEADILALLPAPAPPTGASASSSNQEISLRERLVLDAACGGDAWRIEVLQSELEFVDEEDPEQWSACVSVIVRLVFGHDVHHDETGTGRTSRKPTKEEAESEACKKALDCGVRRLVKRYAGTLGQHALSEIERQVRSIQGVRYPSGPPRERYGVNLVNPARIKM